ncbi:MAG: DUF29 domain-containing protein [Hyphomicrobiales bacterium]|nr:DUF29 domain-containing protein [Hyphomicrobiales bacterium]
MNDLYEADRYAWTKAQADALRRRASNEIDWDHVAEEIAGLGTSREDEIESRLENLLLHLLKWKHQPAMQGGSWLASIREARYRIGRVIKKNPSLKNYSGEYLMEAYAQGRELAIDETGLRDFPEACPWTIEQILDAEFLP